MTTHLEFHLTLYPHPVLRKVAEPVQAFDDELRETVRAMFELMAQSEGVGLAAPQVGIKKRILVLNPTGQPADALALVNPTITGRSGAVVSFEEGCLSFPGIFAEVRRPERCSVQAFDVYGRPLDATYEGFQGRIVQHEYDHLEGVLLVDRMSPADKLRHKGALDDLVQRYRSSQSQALARRL